MISINKVPKHVAIIMDGNGRWAQTKNKLRIFGHKMGAENIGKIVDAAIQERVQVLSLFAFSCENRNRPKSEVVFLMKLFQNTLNSKTIDKLNKRSVQLRWTGLRDKLSSKLLESILLVQAATKHNKKLILNICFNYGGMQDILQAARNAKKCKTIEDFNRLLLTKDLPPVDLLIRTGNEKRISNFLLWQSAYAEIIFTSALWPAYNGKIFHKNLIEFSNRGRRFGKIN